MAKHQLSSASTSRLSQTKSLIITFAILAALPLWLAPRCAVMQTEQPDYRDPSLPVERRVADLLNRMTLEEKVAQTHSLWIQKSLITDDAGNFSPEKAKEVLRYGLGQIARPSEVDNSTGRRRGPREMAVYFNAVQKYLIENTRLGIPVMSHEEALHGHAAKGGTIYPIPMALASSWNTDLVHRIFTATAAEVRARGAQQVLTPVLDLAWDPRWGRTEETYGEDPYLVSRMGVACITGLQGSVPIIDQQHVISTAKHFIHGQQEGGTNIAPSNLSERGLRESYLIPFEAAVKEAHVMSVMPSYNEVNGVPMHANAHYLRGLLRQEWGFRGYLVSDYFAIPQLEENHHIVANQEDAGKVALEAGVDIELPDSQSYGTLAQQVRDGRISTTELDAAVANILRAKFITGLFEHPYVDPDYAEKICNNEEHQKLALEAARESITLLKNQNNLLPLDRSKIKTIAVIGPNADKLHLGGYSEDPGRGVTMLQGVKDRAGSGINVVFSKGVKITGDDLDWRGWGKDAVQPPDPVENAKLIASAAQVAKTADIVVMALGDNEQTCREAYADNHLGDRDSLDLLSQQDDLIKAVLATGKPVVALIMGGRPLSINYVAEHVPAILQLWYLGEEGGDAVGDVLFGDYNPGGKLPITVPRSVGQLPDYYCQKPTARRGYVLSNRDPLYPFGFGLSYTSFQYGEPRLSEGKIGLEGHTTVSVDVTNNGSRAGDEVVQMYIRDEVSSVTRPVKELKGFQRIGLKPGETKTVTFDITRDKLAFYNLDMKRVVEPGVFDIMVGPSSVNLKTVKLEAVSK